MNCRRHRRTLMLPVRRFLAIIEQNADPLASRDVPAGGLPIDDVLEAVRGGRQNRRRDQESGAERNSSILRNLQQRYVSRGSG